VLNIDGIQTHKTMERIVTRHAIRLTRFQSTPLSRSLHKPLPQQHLRYRSNDSKNDNQVHPLTGYYADILSSRQPPTDKPLSTPTSTIKDQPQPSTPTSAAAPTTPASPESLEAIREQTLAKARIVFGSSGSSRREHKDAIALASKEIAGIKVPPKPKEPTGDDCCMSGCVNCVWDIYREEFEEWSAAAKSAREKMVAMQQKDAAGEAGAAEASSVDDDGGGSEALWIQEDADQEKKDPFADVPVGMREFMRIEKMLKEKQAAAQQAASKG
jgi:predicted  nucleic acid-binding Zn-ribbon protein